MLEQLLDLEILKSEKLRLTLLAIVFMGMTLISFGFFLYSPKAFHHWAGEKVSIWILPVYFILVACYFFIMRLIVIRRQKKLSTFMRFFSAFIEVSIPTGGILIIAFFEVPLYALLMPPVLAYSIFIILSALTLNEWLCRFSGFVASTEYLLLSFWIIHSTNTTSVNEFLVGWYAFAARGVILFIEGMVTAFITSQIKVRLMNAFNLQKERDRVEHIFGQHVSPQVASKLLSKNGRFSETIPVCILFLDIRNFSHFSEINKPSAVVEYLNYLFAYMVEIIDLHKGIINKFLGDGFMAIFGAPIASKNDVEHALKAALAIIKRTDEAIKEGSIPDLKIGIGIHFGDAITGTVGTEKRLEYTIVGDVVNSAAHIEQMNKIYDTTLLISEAALEQFSGNIHTQFIGNIQLKHRNKPIKLYTLVEPKKAENAAAVKRTKSKE